MQHLTSMWLERLFGHEGVLSMDPSDRGNWTGGRVNVGELRGSKFGISAAAYPNIDIARLTREQAAAIYVRDYLAPLKVERYPDGVGFQFFDWAVNSGVDGATRGVQRALGVLPDGRVGPKTLAALGALSESDLIMRLLAQRIRERTVDPGWVQNGRGWMNRIATNLLYGAEDS